MQAQGTGVAPSDRKAWPKAGEAVTVRFQPLLLRLGRKPVLCNHACVSGGRL